MKDLHNRKKLLIAECEVYRKTLKFEIQNIRLYAATAASELKSPASYLSLLLGALPIARTFFGAKKPKTTVGRLARLAFVGWRTFTKYGPMFRGLFSPQSEQTSATAESLEERI